MFSIALFFLSILVSPFLNTPHRFVVAPDFYLMLACAIVVVPVGVKIGQRSNAAQDVLATIARAASLLGYVSFLFTQQTSTYGMVEFSWVSVGWPLRIVELFGFLYYLQKILNKNGFNMRNIMWLLGPGLSTIGIFTKNIILPLVFGLLVLLVHNLCLQGRRLLLRRAIRPMVAGVAFVVGAYLLDLANGGHVVRSMSDEIFSHILKSERAQDFSFLKTLSMRDQIWSIAWTRFLDSPLFGNGFGQVIITHQVQGLSNELMPLHNGFIDLLVSVGLVGSLGVAIPGVSCLLKILSRRCFLASGEMSPAISGFAGALVFFNMGSTSKLFYATTVTSLLIMAIAFGMYLSRSEHGSANA